MIRVERTEAASWFDFVHQSARAAPDPMTTFEDLLKNAPVVELTSKTKDDALRELAEVFRAEPKVADVDRFLKAIFDREKVISTGIGIGVAVPHVKIPEVIDFVLAFGRHPGGLDFDSLDEQPVHLVAMIAASESQAGEFLKMLARLVQTLRAKDVRRRLLFAKDATAFRAILLERAASPS
ncbi:MAG: PTS sugar transporter subunit IIA [Candidatus Sumerlaeota bacterium]|nr:PTS sugar transporter subunit IIA [Candidatus Sumerlaeota bacterium]